MRARRLAGIRLRGTLVAIVASAIGGGTLTSGAEALTYAPPTVTFDAGGVSYDITRAFAGNYAAGAPLFPLVPVTAFPFTARLEYAIPPVSVTAELQSGAPRPLGGAEIAVAPVDADTWTVKIPAAVPEGARAIVTTDYDRAPSRGTYTYLVRLAVPPVVALLRAVRRPDTVVVRLRANVTGFLTGAVRQGGEVQAIAPVAVRAQRTRRLVLIVPRPELRTATVTLRLAAFDGRVSTVTRTLR